MIDRKIKRSSADTLLNQSLHNGLGHHFSAVPHGIIDNERLDLASLLTPFIIAFEYLSRVFAPYEPVIRGDHIYREINLFDLG